MKIVFFGTSSFAARILTTLINNGIEVVAVVTRPDKPRGRQLQLFPPPVKETALQIDPNFPVFQPLKASTPEFVETLAAFNADLFVVVAYGEIVKKNLLDLPPKGCINIHASLLPKYRGAAPIQRCLMAGESETGITIIEMTPEMDAGAILAIKSIPIPEEMTFGELEPKLCQLAGELILNVIDQCSKDTVVKIEQDHQLATFAPKMTAADEFIDWKKNAWEIHNQIRALSPSPSAWCMLNVGDELKRLKIKKSLPLNSSQNEPGAILSFNKEGWVISCGSGALRLLEVQLEGKKSMLAEEFIRGTQRQVSIKI